MNQKRTKIMEVNINKKVSVCDKVRLVFASAIAPAAFILCLGILLIKLLVYWISAMLIPLAFLNWQSLKDATTSMNYFLNEMLEDFK